CPVAEADVGRVARDRIPAARLGVAKPGEQVLGVDGSEGARLRRLVCDEFHTVCLAAERGQLAQDCAVAAGWLEDPWPRVENRADKEPGHWRRGVVAAPNLVGRRDRLARERPHLRISKSATGTGSRGPAGSSA